MKLAYLTSQYPAPSHTFIRREIEALRDLGCDIDTYAIRPLTPEEIPDPADRAEAERTVYVLRQSPVTFVAAHVGMFVTRPIAYLKTFGLALTHRVPGGPGFLLGIAHFAESVVLAHELKKRRTDHVHNHFANSAATVGLLATRLLGIGWSFTMHGISETDYPAGLMLGRKIAAADMVACVSWFGRAQGMRLVGSSHWGKMHVVRCGLPFDRVPIRSPRKSDEQAIICVGRWSPEKGHAGLLRVVAELKPRFPKLRLRLVGYGPAKAELEALASDLGISDSVDFLGRLTEEATLAEIARSDILALPSFMEGLPIVLMEAMSIGVPVVASRVAGTPELVEDGESGLLFTPSNWNELRDRIERLLTDQHLYAEIAERGKAKVAAEFDARKSAGEMLRLFETAATNRIAG